MLQLQISGAVENKTTIYSPGTMVFSAHPDRDGLGQAVWRPKYLLSAGSALVSGLSIDYLHVDLWEIPRHAQNQLLLTSIPNDGETLTVGNTTYTFRPSASGLVESTTIKIYDNVLGTMVSIYKVINNIGSAGVDYGCPVNEHARNNYPTNPLIFEAVVSGVSGQNTYMSTTASGITIASKYFYNGVDPSYEVVYTEDITFPFKTVTSATSPNTLTTTLDGITYEGQAYFVNVSGLPVVASGTGDTLIFPLPALTFTSHSDMQHLFEVSGLTALDLNVGKINHDQTVSVSWTNMQTLTEAVTLPIDFPSSSGPQTQSTSSCAGTWFGQILDYYVFVCSGLTTPQCAWPRAVDANVTWYLAGVTRNNYADIHVPLADYVGIWVGFTDIRDGIAHMYAPYNRTNSGIYLI